MWQCHRRDNTGSAPWNCFSSLVIALHFHGRKCSQDTENKQLLFSCHFPAMFPIPGSLCPSRRCPHTICWCLALAFQALGNPLQSIFVGKAPFPLPSLTGAVPLTAPFPSLPVQCKSQFGSVRSSLGSVGYCAVIPVLLGALGALPIICLYSRE